MIAMGMGGFGGMGSMPAAPQSSPTTMTTLATTISEAVSGSSSTGSSSASSQSGATLAAAPNFATTAIPAFAGQANAAVPPPVTSLTISGGSVVPLQSAVTVPL